MKASLPRAPPGYNIKPGESESIVVVGRKGTGKTEVCRRLWARAVVDPLGQYPASVSVRPTDLSPRALDAVCRDVWSWQSQYPVGQAAPFRLGIEEAEAFLPEGRPLLPATKMLLQLGRNLGITTWANTRAPQALHKRVLDEADHLFVFQLYGRALDYMVEYLGAVGPALYAMRDEWDKEDHRFVHWTRGQLVECKPLRL